MPKMKRQTIMGVIAIMVIIAVAMFAGCVEKEAPETAQTDAQMSTPTPTTTSTPGPTLTVERPAENTGNSGA
jgi:PBP1b-binding outer membrane lipoprotein LpoB